MPEPESSTTTCRPTCRTAGNISCSTTTAGLRPVRTPLQHLHPPTSTSQIRHVDPETGLAEIVALGVRNSVGGDVDPRTGDYWFTENARDWLSDDLPSDKLNHMTKIGQNLAIPTATRVTARLKFAMGHKCSEFAPPA